MEVETEAIVCALKAHGEHGGVLRLLTPENGLVACYVRGARGRRMRPVLIPGNVVTARLRARNESQLPQAAVELVSSRAPLLSEPLPAAAVEWVASLVAATLPERQPYPALYDVVSGFLGAVEASPSAIGWAAALAQLEMLLVAQLGYAREPVSVTRKADVLLALDESGRALKSEILAGCSPGIADARSRLVERLRKALPGRLPDETPNPTSAE